jgi:uncharacterized membrane protein YidH (DUF202 family)
LIKQRQSTGKALAAWKELDIADVPPPLLELVSQHLSRELTSREVLTGRLVALVTFAGALLALGLGLAHNAAGAELSGEGRVAFSVLFVLALVLLVVSIVRSLIGVAPRRRPLPNPELLRHYATQGTEDAEIRADTFKLYGAAVETIGDDNGRIADAVRDSLGAIVVALCFAAGAAGIVYFESPWATANNHSLANPLTRVPVAISRPPKRSSSRISGRSTCARGTTSVRVPRTCRPPSKR